MAEYYFETNCREACDLLFSLPSAVVNGHSIAYLHTNILKVTIIWIIELGVLKKGLLKKTKSM